MHWPEVVLFKIVGHSYINTLPVGHILSLGCRSGSYQLVIDGTCTLQVVSSFVGLARPVAHVLVCGPRLGVPRVQLDWLPRSPPSLRRCGLVGAGNCGGVAAAAGVFHRRSVGARHGC